MGARRSCISKTVDNRCLLGNGGKNSAYHNDKRKHWLYDKLSTGLSQKLQLDKITFTFELYIWCWVK